MEDGIRLAETTGGPAYDVPLFEYKVELIIEEDPDNPEPLLYQPTAMLMDDAGCFYVWDSGDYRIVAYDQQGHYIRSFGREGAGPGEFQEVEILRLEGDAVILFDYDLQRTTRFRTDGTLLGVQRYPELGSWVMWIEHLPNGGYIYDSRPDRSQAPDNPKIFYEADRVVATSADGDTLCDITTPFVPWGYTFSSDAMQRMEFVGYPQIQYIPDHGILMSTGVEPVLTWYDLHGRVTERIRLELEVELVSTEEKEIIRQRARERAESASGRSAFANASLDALRIPDEKAFWNQVVVDESGYYWLQYAERYETRREMGGPLCRVLSPEGEYLGDSRWPTWYGTIKNGLYLTMVSDEETGAITPTVFRIVPVVEGLVYP